MVYFVLDPPHGMMHPKKQLEKIICETLEVNVVKNVTTLTFDP